MKCVAKTVSGAIAEIDVEPTDTLAELKVRSTCAFSSCAFSSCAISASPTRLDLPLRQGERRGLAHKRAGVLVVCASLATLLAIPTGGETRARA